MGSEPPEDSAHTAWTLRLALLLAVVFLTAFIAAAETKAIGTLVPTVTADFDNGESPLAIWLLPGYALTEFAFAPWAAGLCGIFGRRDTLLAFLAIFAVACALIASAQSMTMLIAGVGSAGCFVLPQVLLSDAVPLSRRGLFVAFVSGSMALGALVGPPIAGALAETWWRGFFLIAPPICIVCAVLAVLTLRLKVPRTDIRHKLASLDVLPNLWLIASSVAFAVGATQGGVRQPWASARTLVPLVLGALGIIIWPLLEARAAHPTLPPRVATNRTSAAALIAIVLNIVPTVAIMLWTPVHLQSVFGLSPAVSGVYMIAFLATSQLMILAAGWYTTRWQSYKPPTLVGLAMSTSGLAFLARLPQLNKIGVVGSLLWTGIGSGIAVDSLFVAVLAPLPPSLSAPALGAAIFCESFGNFVGFTISSAIVQSHLLSSLSDAARSALPSSELGVFAVIAGLPTLDETSRDLARSALFDALQVMYYAMAGIAGLGFLVSLAMRALPLASATDEQWGLAPAPAAAADAEKP